MTEPQLGSLIYLIVLGSALLAMFVMHHRQGIGATLKQIVSWALIFLAVLAGYGLWEDVKTTVVPSQSVITETDQIIVPRSSDGHYYLTLEINNKPVRFMVDTGATDLVLTQQDARKAGLDPTSLPYYQRANTANGQVRTAPVTLDTVTLGPFTDRDVKASVNDGDMFGSLLGMRYLDRYRSLEFSNGNLILTR